MMVDFKPDTVIALGGGSAMDAAKGMCSMSTQILHSSARNKKISVNGHTRSTNQKNAIRLYPNNVWYWF